MREGTCLHCGAPFVQRPGPGRNRSWCYDCLPAADGSKDYRTRAADLADFKSCGEHVRCCGRHRCASCHVIFEPWCDWHHPGAAGTRCRPCYLAYTRRRQTPKTPNPRPRQPKTLGQARSLVFKAECAAAHLPCALCGDPIDYTLTHPDRMSFSVDHIIPTGQGGAVTDRANLQPSHLSCNARKGRIQQDGEPVLFARAALWLRDAMQEVNRDRHARTSR